MSKRSVLPQARRHILVYDEDWEFLDSAYGKDSDKPIGVGVAIRQLVHASVLRIKAQMQQALDGASPVESEAPAEVREDTNL